MGKRVKEKQIYVRVNDVELAKINAYTEAAEITISELVRTSVEEYMTRHPVKEVTEAPTNIKQPGA